MIDAGQATEYLTSTIKGFKLEVSEAMDAVSMMTNLDMELATSSGDLMEALSRTATSAQMAGMSLAETAAAVGTIIDVSQKSASSVGESWKTLLSRYGNVKAGSFVDLETGEVDENLNDTEKVLNTIGISIRSSTMEFRDFSDVLDDLADKWVSLSSVEQNAVATAMAGTRQRENFNILMENYDKYQDAIETASNSQGVAEEKYEAYLDSIEAHLAQLKDAWDELAQNFEGSAFFKGVVDVAKFLVEQLPKIIKLFSTLFMTMNAYKLPTWLSDLWGAVNPLKSVSAGRFKGARSRFTTGGMEDRANIRKYERLKAEGKDTSEIEAKLPKEYRDTFVTGDGNLNDTAKPIVDEQRKTNSTLDSIESMVQTITSSSSSAAGPMISIKGAGPTGIDPEPIAKLRNEVGDIHQKGTLKYDEWRAKQRVGNLQSAYNARNLDEKISEKAASLGGDSTEEDLKAYNDLVAERARRLQEIDSASKDRLAITNKIAQKEAEINRLLKEQEAARQTSASEVVSESRAEMTITAEKKTQLQQEQLATQEDIKQRIEEEKSLAAEKGQLAAEQAQTTQDQIQAATEASSTGFNQLTTVPGQSLLPGTATSGITPGVPKKAGIGSKITSKLSGLSGSAGLSAFSGIMGGLTAGITAAATQEGDATDKAVAAASNAVTTGLISAIPGIGPILGGVLGPILGDWISGAILDAIHEDENLRQERVEEAQEQLKVLEEIESNTEAIGEQLKTRDDWDTEDFSKMNTYISEMLSLLRTESETRQVFMDLIEEMNPDWAEKSLSEILNILVSGTDEEAQMIQRALDLATSERKVEEIANTQEIERKEAIEAAEEAGKNVLGDEEFQNYTERMNNASLKLSGSEKSDFIDNVLLTMPEFSLEHVDNDDSDYYYRIHAAGATNEEKIDNLEAARDKLLQKQIEYQEQGETYMVDTIQDWLDSIDESINALEQANQKIDKLDDDLNVNAVEDAFKNSIASWDNIRISNSTLDEAVNVMAEKLQLAGESVYTVTGEITDAARSRIEAYLREQDEFSKLFSEDERTLRQLLGDRIVRNQFLNYANNNTSGNTYDYEAMRRAFDTHDDEAQAQLLKDVNEGLEAAGKAQITLDQLRNDVYNMDPKRLGNYANALGLTVDEVERLKKVLGNTSVADLLGDPSDTISEISDKIGILTDYMSNGALSAENYFKILSAYPEMLYEIDEATNKIKGISADNIIPNMFKDLYGSESSSGTLLGFQTYEELKSNESLFSGFKEMVQSAFPEKDLTYLDEFSTFTDDVLAKINQDAEIWEIYEGMMSDMSVDVSAYQDLVQGLLDYQSTLIDQQIEGLKSQKEALDDINDARQKELDLIKAKDALENAKKEKKTVYRAGVGWTYESDQTAVQEAQQELEDLETNKEQEDLQYQIDQLEQMKSFLEAIPSSEELNAQKEIFQSWMDTITSNGETQTDILSELSTAYTQINAIAESISTWVGADKNVQSSAAKAYIALTGDKNTEGSFAAVQAAQKGISGAAGSEEYYQTANAYNNALDSWGQNLRATGINNFVGMSYEEAKETGKLDSSITSDQYTELQKQWSSYTSSDYAKRTDANDIALEVNKILNNTGGEYEEVSSQKQKLKITPSDTWGSSEVLVSPGAGFNTTTNKNDALWRWTGSSWEQLAKNEKEDGGWTYPTKDLDNMPSGTLLAAVTSKEDQRPKYAYKTEQGEWAKATEAAKGSLGLPGGWSLINEMGTEGIITPEGTLTALPSKTGIVPADLTKKLANLGEAAPNLIKNLDSLSMEYPSSALSSSDDHSTNIQNLYATFQAEEGFSFDDFLIDVRGIINTSRHST